MSRSQAGETAASGPGDPRPRAGLGSLLRATLVAFGVGVLGFVLGAVILVVGFNLLAIAGLVGTEPSGVVVILVSTVSLQGVAFPLVALAYLRWRNLPLSFLRARAPSLRDLGMVVLAVVAILVLAVVSTQVISLLGLTPAERADQEILTQPRVALVGIPLMLLLVGPGEELLFRGVIQSTIREVASAPVAIVLASAAFAPAHLVAYLGTGASPASIALSISVLFLPSLVFGSVFEYTDNLVVPSLAHGLWNSLLLASVLLGPAALVAAP